MRLASSIKRCTFVALKGALHRDHAGELSVVNVNAVLNSFPAPPALAMRPRRSCLGDSGS